MGKWLTQLSTVGDLSNALGTSRVAILFPGDNGTINQDAVDLCISRAESLIETKVYDAFASLPTDAPILKTMAIAFATFFAYEGKPEFYTVTGYNPVQQQFNMAMKLLDQLHDGDIGLDGTAPAKSNIIGGYVAASSTRFIVDIDEENTPTGMF